MEGLARNLPLGQFELLIGSVKVAVENAWKKEKNGQKEEEEKRVKDVKAEVKAVVKNEIT